MKAGEASTAVLSPPLLSFEHKRDAYGFAVRPQHVQRYHEYANIYKEEEEESTGYFRGRHNKRRFKFQEAGSDGSTEDAKMEGVPAPMEIKTHGVQIWTEIRPSLHTIEGMMSKRVNRKNNLAKKEQDIEIGRPLPPVEEVKSAKGASEEDSEEEFYDVERSDPTQDTSSCDSVSSLGPSAAADVGPFESLVPWKEELECLVRGGVPMALRGELWQAFVGVRARRVEKYYQDLLGEEIKSRDSVEQQNLQSENSKMSNTASISVPEKWKGQIEKDLPRTFPGHPALDEGGRNALRRLLTAYARHNPSVGYCQAMNFFAGLLLLLMPEENAFLKHSFLTFSFISWKNTWHSVTYLCCLTLMSILDDYFDGYYSEEMIESQVDQLVFEELVRERFPKLVNHLDYLGVQVAWVTGPWFLSIFMNMLPWESVLRVWDVLLFEGNRVMLFRTALALMELYGPPLATTKDAGDAVTLLQSLAGSTFDSSQLVLTACMGYQNVNEVRLQELRNKHRPAVRAAVEERSKGFRALKDSKGLASKLYIFKRDPGSMKIETCKPDQLTDAQRNGDMSCAESASAKVDEFVMSLHGDAEVDSVPDLEEQAVWLKVELCKLLEEKRSAVLRAEELETALMEMVKQDNRRQLSARVEELEREVAELHQAVADKQEQENAMLQVLMRVEQEQRVTEDARIFAEQDAAAQRYAAQLLQEKYEEVTATLAEMEKRAVMAESMLEATLQYQSGQTKAQPSPRSVQQDFSPVRTHQEPAQDLPMRKITLLSRPFGLGWRDRNKVSYCVDSST
ncbi:Ypt/Rab-GAP domain of gyp1p superfamily protein [Actinidia rufa]|uniref:Ypt/Rab-GAP domain of gyp1p superfamily protein n=1 Tax=Actinidia rufa TaxID=165716 RepID=A0A7J0EG54_9ERIC|nr:Ypt/Rab-GAP domain of gyp1p superfamily protein [Actinidia rufa]